jgi:hypothetical protein
LKSRSPLATRTKPNNETLTASGVGGGGDTMSTLRQPGVGNAGAKERMARIREEMAVEDASGERFGRVTDVHIDAADAINGGFVPEMGVRQAPNLPAELTGRLLHASYIKIEDTRFFRRDFRYYVTIDQISSVNSAVVRLNRYCRDLITAFD